MWTKAPDQSSDFTKYETTKILIFIAFIFNSFLYSKSSLNKKLLNLYLIKVHERDTCLKYLPKTFNMLHDFIAKCFMIVRNDYGRYTSSVNI